MSKTNTAAATARAPGELKMIGIQAGASRRIQVISPGPASKRRAPNWRIACWRAETGCSAGTVAMNRLWRRPQRQGGYVFAQPQQAGSHGREYRMAWWPSSLHGEHEALRRPDF